MDQRSLPPSPFLPPCFTEIGFTERMDGCQLPSPMACEADGRGGHEEKAQATQRANVTTYLPTCQCANVPDPPTSLTLSPLSHAAADRRTDGK